MQKQCSVLQEPEPAQLKESHKSLETGGTGSPAKKLKKEKHRKSKAAEVVHSLTEDVKRKSEEHRGQDELERWALPPMQAVILHTKTPLRYSGRLPLSGGHACSAPLVAETDMQALTQKPKKKKKKKETKTAAALKSPSGPGNAEEARQIRSIMGDHLTVTCSILEDGGVSV